MGTDTASATEQRVTIVVVSIGAGLLALVWGIALVAGPYIISGVLEGRFLTSFGEAVRIHMTNNPKHVSFEYYVDLAASAASRAFFLWVACGSALIVIQRWNGDVVTEFVTADGDALSLAVTRIVVFLVLVYSVNVSAIETLASQPSEMLKPPQFMGWFVDLVPLSPAVAGWAARLLIVTGILAAAGALTRYTTVVTVILAIYVFGIPQYFGKISHGMHGMLWIAMILAVSPCGSALSVDRRFGLGISTKRARVFGISIRMIWFLFACVYFFPGVWKFVVSGWDWALSDNLKFKMHSAWRGGDFVPAFRIDHYPILFRGMALLTMLWEIAFPFLILFRKSRIVALVMGAFFHIGVWNLMHIGPPLIMLGYVSFVDWEAVRSRVRGVPISIAEVVGPWRLTTIVGGVLCILVFLFGITLTDSWPFAVYPTHAGVRGPTVQTVEMVAVLSDGKRVGIDIEKVASVTSQSVDFAVIAGRDSVRTQAYLRGLAEIWEGRHDSTQWVMLEFYSVTRLLSPEARYEPPLTRDRLFSVQR